MLYVYIILLLVVLGGVAWFFIHNIKAAKLPGNAKMVVDAWNSVTGPEKPENDRN